MKIDFSFKNFVMCPILFIVYFGKDKIEFGFSGFAVFDLGESLEQFEFFDYVFRFLKRLFASKSNLNGIID